MPAYSQLRVFSVVFLSLSLLLLLTASTAIGAICCVAGVLFTAAAMHTCRREILKGVDRQPVAHVPTIWRNTPRRTDFAPGLLIAGAALLFMGYRSIAVRVPPTNPALRLIHDVLGTNALAVFWFAFGFAALIFGIELYVALYVQRRT